MSSRKSPKEPRASASGLHAPGIDPQHACFAMRLGRSGIHRLGVYAAQDIPANRKVIEYTGEKISRRETKRRVGRRLNYIFTLDNYWCVDGGVGGSGAEFINHSCEPNLTTHVLKGHILYYSNRKIRKGEELLVDYHYPYEVQTVRCKCGAKNCRGTINHLKSTS
jgi:SET domain-containing protein